MKPLDRKKYWRSLEELANTQEFQNASHNEFDPSLSELLEKKGEQVAEFTLDRRDFLKLMGFGAASVMAACSRMPIKKSIPYLVQPEEIVPGKAYWYASACAGCTASCGILVKTREGRPIKIEGNPDSPINQGGLCAVGQSTVLELYDSARLQYPLKAKSQISWQNWDTETTELLRNAKSIALLTPSILSPSTRALIQEFTQSQNRVQHVVLDSVSASSILAAHKYNFKKSILPHYRFDEARVIVSFSADFLGTWISPVEFAKQYQKGRDVELHPDSMSQHFQFESRMSLTGANADVRVPLTPSQQRGALVILADRVLKKMGHAGLAEAESVALGHLKKTVLQAADALLKFPRQSLLVADIHDVNAQILVNQVNAVLGNYGKTLDIEKPSLQKQGDDEAVAKILNEIESGLVDVVVTVDVNPVYNAVHASLWKAALQKTKLISFVERLDETSELAQFVAPIPHGLESWNDVEPVVGTYHVMQPTVPTLYESRPWQESLLKWQNIQTSYLDAIKDYWQKNIFSKQSRYLMFADFWKHSVQSGVAKTSLTLGVESVNLDLPKNLIQELLTNTQSAKFGFEFEVFESVALRDGHLANNPWLQELPDPITKVTWENTLNISIEDAKRLELNNGDVVQVSANESVIEIPIYIQPGQAVGALSVALGYGRTRVGKVGDGVGQNVFAMSLARSVKLETTSRHKKLAMTQTHYLTEGRPIVRDATFKEFQKNPGAANAEHGDLLMLWEPLEAEGHKWSMAIDMNKCIGCSGCLVGCQAENNVPVVGKEEVAMGREMHWIRIDRYYQGDVKNPSVAFQPMLCQHCGNAPCESVCPVLATVHSSDGLNQQVYNRCVGTRYCANNCPYKVRRFNWFDYAGNKKFDFHMNNEAGRLVLNPDIVVRSRGVMEKCSMCVQRIQEKRLEAKVKGKNLNSDDIKLACQQSCPSDAIVFGDLNDPKSRLAKMLHKNKRSYDVLGELNVRPAVHYLSKVRNKE